MLSFTNVLTMCYPFNCVEVIFASSKTTTVDSTKMLKTKEKRKMRLAVRVLMRNSQPNECLSTQGTFVVKEQFDCLSASFHLLG